MRRRPVNSGLPEPHLRRNSRQIQVYTGSRRRWPLGLLLLLVGAVLVFLAIRSLAHSTRSAPTRTPPRHVVAAAPPAIARPVPLTPHNGSRVSGSTHLCWSAVAAASGYKVWIAGRPPVTTTGTCRGVTLRPGTYTWRVAALRRGRRTSIGRYSVAAHFTVLAPRTSQSWRRAAHVANLAPAPAPAAPTLVPQPPSQLVPVQQAPVYHPAQSIPSQHPRAQPVPVRPKPAQPPASRRPRPTPASGGSGCIPLYTC